MSCSIKKNYTGRVEYRAVQKEVEDKLTAGHRVRPIYEELRQAGRISISYSTFCAYVRGRGERRPGREKSRPAWPKPTLGPPERRGFHHEKMADLEELGPPRKRR